MTRSKTNSQPFDHITKDGAEIIRNCTDACMRSSSIYMEGSGNIVGTALSLAQASAEKQAQFAKEALSSKTINEWAEIWNRFTQTNFDDFMTSATKLSEMSVKIMTECAEPLNEQMTKAIRKTSEAMAA